jgi:peptide subunit release factor 1 (eRF1)
MNLRTLAGITGPDRAFLSVYLPQGSSEKSVDHKTGAIRSLLSEHPDELEHFEQNLKLLKNQLEVKRKGSQGFCSFICWALDFAESFSLPEEVRIQPLTRIGSSPYIRPWAEFHDEYENFVVIMADNRDAQVITITAAAVQDETSIKGNIKNHVKVGGWSQKRYQRRREVQLHHYAKEIVASVESLEKELTFRRIIMAGSQETLRVISDAMPEPMRSKVAETEPVDFGKSDDDLWHEIYRAYFQEERQSEQELWQKIREEFLSGGRGAAGPADVLQAAQEGRIQIAVVTRDAKIEGWQCRSCEQITSAKPERCPSCRNEELFSVDLVNKLATLCVNSSAEIDFVDPIPGLEKVHHMAALLRY